MIVRIKVRRSRHTWQASYFLVPALKSAEKFVERYFPNHDYEVEYNPCKQEELAKQGFRIRTLTASGLLAA